MPLRSLADDLRSRGDDELALLLRGRPDLLHPPPPDMTALASRAGTATSTARALDRLDALTLRVAQEMAARGESCAAEEVLAAFDPAVRDDAAAALERLRVLALAWGERDSLRLVRTARDSLAGLPVIPWPPGRVRTTVLDAARAERTAGQHALAAILAVTTIGDAWSGSQAPSVLRKGGLAARDLTATARLLDADEATAALVLEAAHAAGLIARDGEVDERWRPTPAYDDWHDGGLPERWAALAGAWLRMPRAPAVVGEAHALSDDVARPGLPLLRQRVIDVLASLPPGEAPADADEVTRALDLAAPRQASAQRATMACAILREAECLGITGAGALAPMGHALAGGEDPIALAAAAMPAPLDHVLLQADLTAVAPGPLRSDLDRELRLMADVESTGGAVVYRFSAASLRRALDAGRDPGAVRGFLDAVSRTPVPQPLAYLVDDAARQHGVVRVGLATAYVRCDDETVLDALMAHPRAAELGCTRASGTVVTVAGRPEDAIRVLKDLGLHPVPEGVDGEPVVSVPARAPLAAEPSPVLRRDATPALIRATVAGLRRDHGAGTRTRRSGGSATVSLDPMPAADTVVVLRRAIAESVPAWIAYGDDHVLVEPLRMAAGALTAIDRESGEVRTMPVALLAAAQLADPA
ncbi:MAG: helicase-associated domain-containing protein [bacterium]